MRYIVPASLLFTALFSVAVWGEENPYTYVKLSLFVPWTLYFVFLAAVLIPFLLMVLLAWWGHFKKSDAKELEDP